MVYVIRGIPIPTKTDKFWQILTNTEKYREIQSNIVKYWQILSNTNKYWQILSNIYVIRGILISNILVAPPPCLILIQFAHIFFADEHQENLKSINNSSECVLLGGNSWALLGFLALAHLVCHRAHLVCHPHPGLWWALIAPLQAPAWPSTSSFSQQTLCWMVTESVQ